MAFGVACASKQRLWGCAHIHGRIIRITLKPETFMTWGFRHTITVTGKAKVHVKITHGIVAITRKYIWPFHMRNLKPTRSSYKIW